MSERESENEKDGVDYLSERECENEKGEVGKNEVNGHEQVEVVLSWPPLSVEFKGQLPKTGICRVGEAVTLLAQIEILMFWMLYVL